MSITWLSIVYYAYWVILIYVTLQIIHQYTISSRASAWLFTVYIFPVVGVILYFIFGVKRRKRKMFEQKLSANQKSLEAYQAKFATESREVIQQHKDQLKQFHGLTKMVYRDASSRLTIKNKLTLLENGEQKFPQLFKDISQAKQTIHLEYYIFKFDDIGGQLVSLLIERAKAGVEVRFIYDDYGCLGLNNSVLQRMRSYGIEAWPFAEINLFAFTERLNYRNHRKIVIIDGEIAYLGGINVGDEYVNKEDVEPNGLFWRDSHLKIEGQGVSYLQNIFLNDWNFCTGQDIEIEEALLPHYKDLPAADNKMLQVVSSGPDSPQPTILFSILQAIHSAKSEILITTPYFIPNPSLIKALKIAVISGVSVKILVPRQSDSWVVNKASQSYYFELLQTGIEFYQYTKGFVHVKTMVVDGFLSIMGTANFDERSFELNFEVNVLIYDNDFAEQLRKSFTQDMNDSTQLDYKTWKKRSAFKIFTEKVARLISPIL
ncbi:cardiolipin synthase [Marinicella litoralis]|uniref:Cardiolipin synthase n=1 Tax=Marinicella litoralis TaxID=644220 RepID=A0A4R6XMD8_9GAMM|nr:cardiolipin synthase [Marinicella litoralis]TDR20756.1 cardiolipin synthase [Marinicella litoralis]